MLSLLQRGSVVCLMLACVLAFASTGSGAITLTDENSTVSIDEVGDGATSWLVDGVDQLYQQWFWYRIGDTGDESRLDNLGTPSVTTSGNQASLKYSSTQLEVTIFYTLLGGVLGSGQSDLAESIRIRNKTTDDLAVRFFQYSDFDLNGTRENDQLVFANENTVRQTGDGIALSETVTTPPPDFRQGGLYPTIVSLFSDGLPTTLSNTPGYDVPIVGDVSWAFQDRKSVV